MFGWGPQYILPLTVSLSLVFAACSKKNNDEDSGTEEGDPLVVVGGQPDQNSSGGSGGGATPINIPEPILIVNAAPTPGSSGTLSVSAVKADRATVTWTKASDPESAQTVLKYIVYLSSSNNLGTVNDAEANGAAAGGYFFDDDTKLVSGLSESTTYYLNVIVKDSDGKQTVYNTAAFTTTAFPVPGGGGLLTAAHVGADFDVDWTAGADGLTYRLFYSLSDNIQTADDAFANGTAVGNGFEAGITAKTIVAPGSSKRFFLNVLVQNADGNVSAYNSTTFETDAEVFIAYIDGTAANRDLLYVKRQLGQPWSVPVGVDVGATQVYAYPPALAVDANREAHIAYHMTNDGISNVYDLYYARESGGGTFTSEVVATISTIGYYPDLALKSDGKPGIVSYATDSGSDMYYYEQLGGSWSMQPAFSVGTNAVGFFNAMVYDANDKVHACTHNNTTNDVYYVTNASGSWVGELVDSAENVGDYCDIALDQNGKIHLSYYNTTSLDLNYMTNASGAWVRTTVDATGSTGTFTSIAVDSMGFVHISYYNTTLRDVYYATNKSGDWVTQQVDGTGLTAGSLGTSLKLDPLDRPHVAYYDGTYGALRYAYKASDLVAWEITTVHDEIAPRVVGYYPSIDVK